MKALSPSTYLFRHKRQAFLSTMLFALTAMGLYLFIGLAQRTYIDPAFTINRYLDHFSLVQPNMVDSLDPGVPGRILANPDVSQVIPQNNVRVKVANIGGAYFNFRMFGLYQQDISTVLEECGLVLKTGRLPQAGSNEVALSEEIAAGLGLRIGDTFDRTRDENQFRNIGSPLEVVGILSGETRMGILSYEYLSGEGGAANDAVQGLMVFARPGRQSVVADFLYRSIRDADTNTVTYQSVTQQVRRDQKLLTELGIPIVLLISLAIAAVTASIQQFIFRRRMPEFGTLLAFGLDRRRLAHRLAMETGLPALIGFGIGILMGGGVLAVLSTVVYAPRGFTFTPFVPDAILLILPFPLIIVGCMLVVAMRTIRRLDAVAIVERGELSFEKVPGAKTLQRRWAASPRPLSPATYLRRHVRQTATMIGAMAGMVVGATLVLNVFAAGRDALQPKLMNFSRISAISPNGVPIGDEEIARIEANPAVARVFPAYSFSPLRISIPPMFPDRPIETLCVNADDMAYLVDLYDLHLARGRLPQKNTNEIVLPWSVAQNRDIQVGDVIGDRDHPIYPDAPSLPVQLVVSGIFAPAEVASEETWLSFMSLEFVDAFRQSDLLLVVVPQAGQKAALDAWLEGDIASETRLVYTYRNQRAALNREMKPMLLTFSLMSGIILLLAVLVLTGLLYMALYQRTAEFGILNAVGIPRRKLVGRIAGETLFISAAAWGIASIASLLLLVGLQYWIFGPAGLRFGYFDPTSWLFSFLAPLALLVIGAVIAHRMSSRLDPVATIERRS